MRNRHKILLRDHSVPEVYLKTSRSTSLSQLYLRLALPLKDQTDLTQMVENLVAPHLVCIGALRNQKYIALPPIIPSLISIVPPCDG